MVFINNLSSEGIFFLLQHFGFLREKIVLILVFNIIICLNFSLKDQSFS